MRRRHLIASVAVTLALAGCGGGGEDLTIRGISGPAAVPGDADPGDVRVIDGWVTTLADGDVDGAADYFAIPSVTQNGGVVFRIDSVSDAVTFNGSLPCGARLVRAVATRDRTTATFVLTERPGPGVCGAGTGQKARTTFEIADGKIVRWRRVGPGGGGGGGVPGDTI